MNSNPINFQHIQKLCSIRDRHYTTKFYNQPFYNIVRPLVESISPTGGLGCFIRHMDHSEPEATATCLLALHRLNLIGQETVETLQSYILKTNSEVERLGSNFDVAQINSDNCAWSISKGNNVWATSPILWSLIATQYDGVYKPIILATIDWLLKQQYENGGWSVVAYKDNATNVFLTSLTIYTLKLSLIYHRWQDHKIREINQAIRNGCQYIIDNKVPRTTYWSYNPDRAAHSSVEPTTTAMAIWSLYHCMPAIPMRDDIVQGGVTALRRALSNKFMWDNQAVGTGYIPGTDLQQTIQGFTPAIPLILLRLGVDPLDNIITTPINFMLNARTENGWSFYSSSGKTKSIGGYYRSKDNFVGSGEPMTFTTALSIWVIEEWHKQLLRQNIQYQENSGHIQLTLKQKQVFLPVKRIHLCLLLVISACVIVFAYFYLLALLFNQPLASLFANLQVSDIADLLDSIVKLLFFPTTVIILFTNFFFHGKFSFSIVRELWQRIFW